MISFLVVALGSNIVLSTGNAIYKKKITEKNIKIVKYTQNVKSHASAVSLLESGESRYIKVINNYKFLNKVNPTQNLELALLHMQHFKRHTVLLIHLQKTLSGAPRHKQIVPTEKHSYSPEKRPAHCTLLRCTAPLASCPESETPTQ